MNLNALVVGCAVLHFASYAVVCESQGEKLISNNNNKKIENKKIVLRVLFVKNQGSLGTMWIL